MSNRIMFATGALAAYLSTISPPVCAQAASPASFIVVHGIPGRDVSATIDPQLPVDVQVDGKYCLLQGLTFGSIAGPFDVPAGTYTVKVSLANPISPCSNSAVISGSVVLKPGEFGAIVAALSSSGAPTADVFAVDVAPVAAGRQRVEIAHAADAPAVSVTLESTGNGAFDDVRLTNLAPGDSRGASLETNTSLAIAAQVGAATLGPVAVQAGPQSVILGFAVGSAESGSATLLTKVIPSVF